MSKFLLPTKDTIMYAGGTSGFDELTGQPLQTDGMLVQDPFNPTQNLGFDFSNPRDRPPIRPPRPLTPQEFFRIQGQIDFVNFINESIASENFQKWVVSTFGNNQDLDENIEDPNLTNDTENEIFQMIWDSIIGEQEDIPPEILSDRDRLNDFLRSNIYEAAQEIEAAGGYEEWLASQQQDEEEVVGDIDEDTTEEGDTGLEDEIGVDPDMPITDPELDPLDEITTEQEAEEEEEELGILDRIGQWIQSQIGGGTGGAGGGTSSTPPFLPGSAGVIISPGSAGMSWPEILADPGKWTVFLPGVIPGLPESPTILGTIEDILSRPGEVLGGLWNDLVTTVSNPEQVLEDILNDAADSSGLITIGGIAGVVSGILDRIGDSVNRDDEGNIVVNESGSILGGAGEDEDESQGEVVVETSDDKGGSQMGTAPVMDPVQPQPTEGLPIADDSPVSDIGFGGGSTDSPEPQQELGGVADVVSGGGGGGGMMRRGQPHMGGIGYALPQGEMILYRPPTANEILTDFTNGLAMQRKRGMLV